MRLITALFIAIAAWVMFTPMAELAGAKDTGGCCESKTCGEGFIDSFLWWFNLCVAIIFTLYTLLMIWDQYGGGFPNKGVLKGFKTSFG